MILPSTTTAGCNIRTWCGFRARLTTWAKSSPHANSCGTQGPRFELMVRGNVGMNPNSALILPGTARGMHDLAAIAARRLVGADRDWCGYTAACLANQCLRRYSFL